MELMWRRKQTFTPKYYAPTKQIYEECHSILYQENVFFPSNLNTFQKHVLPQMSSVNTAKIRKMVLEVEGITCIVRPAP